MAVLIEELTMSHREKLYSRLRGVSSRLSEFSFANLYLFRNSHKYKFVDHDGCLRITGLTLDKKEFFLPLCEKPEPDIDFLKMLIETEGIIYPVPEEWLPLFNADEFLITHDENDSDYIYLTEKIASFAGRKLHSKRNLLKQFHEIHGGHGERITKNNIDAAVKIVHEWSSSLPEESSADSAEAVEALNLFEELNLEGMIFFSDNTPIGYILGEELTNDTHVLHFAKTVPGYKGSYQFIFNEYAKSLVDKCKYLNFEQDLGLQSLRQAKSSYNPEYMEKKYRISLK
jgi:hypothetical protein